MTPDSLKMMDVIFSADGIDDLDCDVFVAGVFQDERPLKGLSGWIDWRFNGRVSRLLMGNRFTGSLKETVLIPTEGRILARMILLLGLGKKEEYGSLRLRELASTLLEMAEKLRIHRVGFAFPYGERYGVGGDKPVEILLEGMAGGSDSGSPAAEKEWIAGLQVLFPGQKNSLPEMLLGLKTAQSVVGDRFTFRPLVPTDT
jgi:hypothetical protein